jgi:pyruvate ferredoxin oxidoreductase beta subunit
MEISDQEFLAPGHRGCAGCGATVGVRLALKALAKTQWLFLATGCLEVITTPTQKLLGTSPGYMWPSKTLQQ